MSVVATVLVALTAALHGWFLVLEMFLWQKPQGLRTFRMTAQVASETAMLAANQGLYNGFLAAGLALSLIAPQPTALHGQLFLLTCVIVGRRIWCRNRVAADPDRAGHAGGAGADCSRRREPRLRPGAWRAPGGRAPFGARWCQR